MPSREGRSSICQSSPEGVGAEKNKFFVKTLAKCRRLWYNKYDVSFNSVREAGKASEYPVSGRIAGSRGSSYGFWALICLSDGSALFVLRMQIPRQFL